MPCRDYPSDNYVSPTSSWGYRDLKDRADMLARIACKAMTELVEQGKADFLILRDDEVRVERIEAAGAGRRAQPDRLCAG